MDIVYAIFAIIMTLSMVFALRRVVRFLGHLARSGVQPASKTIAVQLVSLILVTVFNASAFFTQLKFSSECKDSVLGPSYAGILSRSFTMIVLLLWRVITVTMLIVFLRQARPLYLSA